MEEISGDPNNPNKRTRSIFRFVSLRSIVDPSTSGSYFSLTIHSFIHLFYQARSVHIHMSSLAVFISSFHLSIRLTDKSKIETPAPR